MTPFEQILAAYGREEVDELTIELVQTVCGHLAGDDPDAGWDDEEKTTEQDVARPEFVALLALLKEG